MSDSQIWNEKDARNKISQLENMLRDRDNAIEELNEIAETAKMLCQGYRKANQTLEEQNTLMRATLEYIASHKSEAANLDGWAVKTASDTLAELNGD